MAKPNSDLKLLDELLKNNKELTKIIRELKQQNGYENVDFAHLEHPLDNDVIALLKKLKNTFRNSDDDYHIFNSIESIKDMWKLIISKSIKCLRFFDKREPFLALPNKRPVAYGVNELSNYFEDYSDFESMLYGSGKYYRDHVVHVFRVWLLGLNCLLNKEAEYLNNLVIQQGFEINPLEKISIWSIIALTHDLGYPLQKAQEIIDKTKKMMRSFVANPIVSLDLDFNGVQSNMNDFVIRFMSSKMREVNSICPKEKEYENEDVKKSDTGCAADDKESKPKKFVARLQPKYYFKLQKSLEQCKHGVLSSIIIYKLLIYFLESDFNINEDYHFAEEDARQFYIRREILRSIASHTCHDIYHLTMLSFAYLLIIVDDAQEWGRKRLSELYIRSNYEYELEDIVTRFEDDTNKTDGKEFKKCECIVSEQFTFLKPDLDTESDSETGSNADAVLEGVKNIFKNLVKQYGNYKEIFRDGQDTANRDFIFTKRTEIITNDTHKPKFNVEFKILNEERSVFEIRLTSNDMESDQKIYGKSFLEDVFGKKKIENAEKHEEKSDEIVYYLKIDE